MRVCVCRKKGKKRMLDFKNMFASRAVWAGIIGFVAVVFDALGWSLGFEQEAAVDAVLKVVEGISFFAAIIFRIFAKKRIV